MLQDLETRNGTGNGMLTVAMTLGEGAFPQL